MNGYSQNPYENNSYSNDTNRQERPQVPVPAYPPQPQAPVGNWNQQPYYNQGWNPEPPKPPVWPQEPAGAQPPNQEPKHKKGGKFLSTVAIVTASALFGFGGGVAAVNVMYGQEPPAVVYRDVERQGGNTAGAGALSVRDIAASAGRSVVSISTESVVDSGFFGQQKATGAGSGVVISPDGYILTNNHVVEGASNLIVTLPDGTEYPATIVGSDPETDVAVIKIQAENLEPATLGDSSKAEVGDFVLAIGNPMGTLSGTVTDGIISARDRQIKIGNYTMELLQMSAAVSPGNSGGGLFDESGNLIGIVNAKSGGSGAEGLGFAIPINEGMQIAEQLMSHGRVTGRPALGITAVEVNEEVQKQVGLKLDPGVYVQSVAPSSAAEAAGLQEGDRIVSMDGQPITVMEDLSAFLKEKNVGDTVEIEVARNGQTMTISLTLQEKQVVS